MLTNIMNHKKSGKLSKVKKIYFYVLHIGVTFYVFKNAITILRKPPTKVKIQGKILFSAWCRATLRLVMHLLTKPSQAELIVTKSIHARTALGQTLLGETVGSKIKI